MERLLRNRWFQLASAVGVVLGIIGFVLQLPPVADIAFGKRTSLSLEVISQIRVFAVQRQTPGLSATFNGVDLTSAKLDLVAARIRLRNTGDVSVNARNTAPSDPLGMAVAGGRLIRITGIASTSDHLRRLARPQVTSNTVLLPPGLMIDPQDAIQFDLLVLKPVNSELIFKALGKVEGVSFIPTRLPVSGSAVTKAPGAWSGGPGTQLLRVITYPFIAIATLFVVLVPIALLASIPDALNRRHRRRIVSKLEGSYDEHDPKLRKLVPMLYVARGQEWLAKLADGSPISRRSDVIGPLPPPPRGVGDFEAAELIRKELGSGNIDSYRLRRLLLKLRMVDLEQEIAVPTLSEAVTRFLSAANAAIDVDDLRRADRGLAEWRELTVTSRGDAQTRALNYVQGEK